MGGGRWGGGMLLEITKRPDTFNPLTSHHPPSTHTLHSTPLHSTPLLLSMKFVEHAKAVTGVIVDVKSPNIIHSCSLDCGLLTFDLIKEKRTIIHMVREGSFLCLSQRLDSEQEVITADANGRMLFWDCDYADPVQLLQDPARSTTRCVSVSPTGRYLATCGNDQLVKVFDLVEDGELVTVQHGHSEAALNIQWSPDEKQIVSVGEDCSICVWNFYGAQAAE